MFPKSNIRFLSAPVIFGGTGEIPPATPLNYLSWGIVGFVFNKFIRNKYRGWWMRYVQRLCLLSNPQTPSMLVSILSFSLDNLRVILICHSSFNYITSAGLDAGLAICTILIIAALNLTNTKAPKWWGNEVVTSTLDAKDKAIQWAVPKEPGFFGPAHW